ncbi:hypothetical protein MVES_002837 [Malassezia vespertilionis]|uniref:CID domain-containing protein n=1 Tax=Malassezia vespertilionis TaxID=2020962 RepID=A0A2N1J9P2_9BASI|nr:hypothetical protein MVES_002837 [Malassezia vespertilionis]
MDPFQIRMEFLALVKTLNASEHSIQKTIAFALQYAHKCADDIWDCVMTECFKAPGNTRINILFMLNSLFTDDFQTKAPQVAAYKALAQDALPDIAKMVVPSDNLDAVLNAQAGDMKEAANISRSDILRRIEEDRERHKRLRENSWKLPPMTFLHALKMHQGEESVTAMQLEFDQDWETTSDMNEDDLDYFREETMRWWGTGSGPVKNPTNV